MKIVTRYVAKDGEEFVNREACLKYEAAGCVHLEPLPKYGDHYPISNGVLRAALEGDGSCYYATATMRSRVPAQFVNHPKWATHIIYFSK